MRFGGVVVGVFVLSLCACTSCHPERAPLVPGRSPVYSSVVLIHAQYGDQGKAGIGTGFFIDEHVLVTAGHVLDVFMLEQVTRRRIGYVAGDSVAELVDIPDFRFIRHPIYDLALIVLPDVKPHAVTRLCEQYPGPGQSVHAVGFPGGKLSEAYGVVLSDYPSDMIFYNMVVIPGFSGGPIEFVGHRCVAGITFAAVEIGDRTYTYGVETSLLLDMLHQILDGSSTP